MIRVGIGYDIHRLVEGRPLILAGVQIPHDRGAVAHSDGDVVCHAIADALLGAAALPNLGALFPDTDPHYKDADSVALLRTVVARLNEAGFVPVQMDANIIAQRPRLQPYVEEMRTTVAGALDLPIACVSIKPRTNEDVGPEGRQEAVSAQAVVVITQKNAAES